MIWNSILCWFILGTLMSSPTNRQIFVEAKVSEQGTNIWIVHTSIMGISDFCRIKYINIS